MPSCTYCLTWPDFNKSFHIKYLDSRLLGIQDINTILVESCPKSCQETQDLRSSLQNNLCNTMKPLNEIFIPMIASFTHLSMCISIFVLLGQS